MDRERLEEFRRLLLSQLRELLRGADRTRQDLSQGLEPGLDLGDQAYLEQDLGFRIRVRERERNLIWKIREALERIDRGTFGICQACGREIPEERLRARPVATLCLDCKLRQEEEERRRER